MRQVFHAGTGLLLAFMVFRAGREAGILLIGSLFILTVLVETLRLKVASINGILIGLFGPMLKEKEAGHPTGVGFFLAGMLICLLLFRLEVALASMVILSVGDPAAAIIGRRWGRIRIGPKSLEGTLTFFISAVLVGIALQDFWPGLSLPLYSIGSLTGAVVELLPLKLDDNLILPVTAGLVMEVSARVFG